jgi:hypothetical protein
MGLKDESSEVKRFTNYVLMLAHEVLADLKDDANNFRTPELNNFLRNEETYPFIQVVVVKTLSNLQKKRAFNKSFLKFVFGRNKDDKTITS